MKFIGDVHGKFNRYKALIKQHQNTIQVGDMGIGFLKWPHGEPSANPPFDAMLDSGARFIRGNHDNPASCRKHQMWIPDGHIEDDMFFVGGAYSIDYAYRKEGFSWWRDEECSIEQLNTIADAYAVAKPRIMVTHDAPLSVVERIHGSHHRFDDTRTQQALQAMFEVHQPDIWIHGHHHVSFEQVVEGTKFICLAELEIKEI